MVCRVKIIAWYILLMGSKQLVATLLVVTPVLESLSVEKLFCILSLQHGERGEDAGLGAGGCGDGYR